MQYNRKAIPKSIMIFGAADHIGGPLAEYLSREAPGVALRLATSSESKAAVLRQSFPAAEVVLADYGHLTSLASAVAGIEGVFVITPGMCDEAQYMTNLVQALKGAGSVIQIIRFLGLHPDESVRQIPRELIEFGRGAEVQHLVARRILDDSGLPVTHLNCGATFMDNFVRLGLGDTVRRFRRLIWPEHLVPWIDPRDVAEVAARLLLSDNHRHIGQFHTINNGQDLLRYEQVAAMLSEIIGETVSFDASKEAFFEAYAHLGEVREYIWRYMQYEQDNEVVWSLNDFAERILGRKPTKLWDWLVEHRSQFFDDGESAVEQMS